MLCLISLCLLYSVELIGGAQQHAPDIVLQEHEVSPPLLYRLEAEGQKETWLQHVFFPNRTLIVIDMQNDFITGSLAVKDAEEIVDPVDEIAKDDVWNQVFYSQDWHLQDHISFFSNVDSRPLDPTWRSEHPGKISMFEEVMFQRTPPYSQVLWPDHCVQGSQGDQAVDTFDRQSNF